MNGDAKKKLIQKIAGFAFAAAIIACCLVLFFLSDTGREFSASLGARDASEGTAGQAREPKRLNSKTAFFEAAKKFGFECECTKLEENERFATYEFELDETRKAQLILTLDDLYVRAFTLSAEAPETPGTQGKNESAIAADLRELRTQECSAFSEKFTAVFRSLVYACDKAGELDYPTVDGMSAAVTNTLTMGEAHDDEHGKFVFSAYVTNGRLTASLTQND